MNNSKKISEIAKFLDGKKLLRSIHITNDVTLDSIDNRSSSVSSRKAFICYQGTNSHSIEYLDSALKNGCNTIISDRNVSAEYPGLNVLVTDRPRECWAWASSFINNHPQEKIKIIGITGTNGKSSTVFILNELLKNHGLKTISIGTLGFEICGEKFDSNHTTPDPQVLFEKLREGVEQGASVAIMEVSSHSISQNKIDPLKFDVYGFTSFSQDHLDFHSSMKEYLDVKMKPTSFNMSKNGCFIINSQIIQGSHFGKRKIPPKTITYKLQATDQQIDNAVTYSLENDQLYFRGLSNHNISFKTPFIGKYANDNLVLAITAALNLVDLDVRSLVNLIPNLPQIPGRLEIVNHQPAMIVDYAHTPDAISNLLETIKDHYQNKIIVVFGCGGDRDKKKRPLMAKAAEKIAYNSIITSDNPRSESPSKIIDDIITGFSKNYLSQGVKIITDRAEAIKEAVKMCIDENSILVIAGKGHEDYQLIGDKNIHFDDCEEIRKSINDSE